VARVEEERDGAALVAKRSYGASGALVEESSYGPKGLSETRSYFRSKGRLVRVEVSGPRGEALGAISYRYDGAGRLAGVSLSGSLGSGAAGMIASGASPNGAWVSDGERLTVQRLDDRGRPLRVETLAGGKAIARRSYAYGEGNLPARAETKDLVAESSVVESYDDAGRVTLRTVEAKGAPPSRTEYRYDEAGRLVEERSRVKSSLAVRSLAYDEAGALIREETRVDGSITGAVEYKGDAKIVEGYYDGALFVRATYEGGRKTREEFYEGGSPIRSRDFR
jgi:YD repeat-containing protein